MKNRTVFSWQLAIALVLVLIATSCQRNPYPGIPEGSLFQDQAYGVTLFLHVDDTTCQPHRVSLYSFDNKTKESQLIVTTAGDNYVCNNDTNAYQDAITNIPTLVGAKVISNQPLLVAAWGSADDVNIDTYLISDGKDSAICLPYSRFLGYSLHENLIITESFYYYGFGGSFATLKVYDLEGHLKQRIPINQQVDIPFDLYQAALEQGWGITVSDLQKLVTEHPEATVQELIKLASTLKQ